MSNIIPLPAEQTLLPGEFQLTPETIIITDLVTIMYSDYLRDLLAIPTGFPLHGKIGNQSVASKSIRLRLDPRLDSLGEDGYRLEVRPEAVTITSILPTGIFYGIQTLRQLLPAAIEERSLVHGVEWRIPCQIINDRPRFGWRGFMLDEGRHFQGKQAVLQTLDLMALQKLNVFHWHLTEDQGWRIEIKKYPRLTEIGSKRIGTSRGFIGKHDGIPHGGFYTQEEIRQVVAYAAERNITVIPEIELPGHCMAALAAYPELSCTGGPFEVATGFGIFPDIYCPGKEATFTFLQDVLDEMLMLFPAHYVHIGGDEAPKKRWQKCPDCQRRIREEGLEDEHALQVWFTNRIATWLAGRGRRILGWNEILGESLRDDAIIQYWAGSKEILAEAVRSRGQQVVMSDFLDAYLDHSYSLTPLSRAYRFDPSLPGVDPANPILLGLEFPLWGEWLPNRRRMEYQAWPRLTAMAETAWTPRDKKDYPDFLRRLESFLERLDRLGVGYAPLRDVEPPKIKQLFGIFTIPQPQTKTSK